MELNEKSVREALNGVADPEGCPLLQSPMLAGIDIRRGQITVVLAASRTQLVALAPLQKEIESRLQKLSGISRVLVTFTAPRAPAQNKSRLQVKRILAIASGKGGVGKSTTAANLAIAFAARGFKTGLLDADIYGPSVPHLFALSEKPAQNEAGKIEPVEKFGIKLMSIGLMVKPEAALVWRGPMIDKALTQFLHDVNWGALDILIIDMPPGTGDAHITLTRRAPIDGAVIVTTPQDLSLIDARKGIALFRQTGVPVLGLIENMSAFICPQCGKAHAIFAHGGAREEAMRQGIAFLGEVPLHIAIRESSDAGAPIAASAHGSREAQAYFSIADQLVANLNLSAADAVVSKA